MINVMHACMHRSNKYRRRRLTNHGQMVTHGLLCQLIKSNNIIWIEEYLLSIIPTIFAAHHPQQHRCYFVDPQGQKQKKNIVKKLLAASIVE